MSQQTAPSAPLTGQLAMSATKPTGSSRIYKAGGRKAKMEGKEPRTPKTPSDRSRRGRRQQLRRKRQKRMRRRGGIKRSARSAGRIERRRRLPWRLLR